MITLPIRFRHGNRKAAGKSVGRWCLALIRQESAFNAGGAERRRGKRADAADAQHGLSM